MKIFSFSKDAAWIGRADAVMVDWKAATKPAPLFRAEFALDAKPVAATLRVCGLGFFEARLNGEKVGDHVLDPVVTQYDRRVRYVAHDVKARLRKGANALGVMLGNGWYNCHTADAWHFDKAVWRDHPKLFLQLDVRLQNGRTFRLCSGPGWRVAEGPVRFDGLRNGEFYDAREERPGWDAPGFDDSAWASAIIVPGPGGLPEEQAAPACKVFETLAPVSVKTLRPGVAVYDFGQNIAGWTRLTAQAEAGREVVLRHGERLDAAGALDTGHIRMFCGTGEFQTDRYTFKGGETETWEPRFTYHGFQYVQAENLPPGATLHARVARSSFAEAGRFTSSDATLNRLADATLRAYRSNFVGIPTDCPHREKNGWTGDAQLAVHTGLFAYAAVPNYLAWLDTMVDAQRPNGQLSSIVPSSGWGYNWGSGPAWDSALILIAWACYHETGDQKILERYYEPARRYVDYLATLAQDGILHFGLGDWCAFDPKRMTPAALTSTAYYYACLTYLAHFADNTRRPADAKTLRATAAKVARAFHKKFYKGNGVYADGQPTALACALYYELVPEREREKIFNALAAACEANNGIADFGILGAFWTPRVLSQYGRPDLAHRIITQPNFPGWVHWLNQGATTLWESWDGNASRNHIMFGDIYAWMTENLAGLIPTAPAWRSVLIKPWLPGTLESVGAEHQTPRGKISVSWKNRGGKCTGKITLPPGTTATLMLPGEAPRKLAGNARHKV